MRATEGTSTTSPTPSGTGSSRPDHGAVQTWVLRSEGKTILVDTGVGSGRDRPQVLLFDHLDTGFVDRLAEGGVRPEDVTLLERAADEVEIVIPAHFAGVGVAEVRRESGRFAIERWAGAD
jgi:hypothetical protein